MIALSGKHRIAILALMLGEVRRCNAIFVESIGCSRHHLYMRLVVHVAADAEVCVVVGIRMDYDWFSRCVAIRL